MGEAVAIAASVGCDLKRRAPDTGQEWVTADGGHPLDRWVDGIRNLSEPAFEAVYHATVDDLLSFANGMLRSRAAAEDVVQEAFVALVRSAPRIRGDGRSLRVWLFRTVRNRSIDEIRRRGTRAIPSDSIPETPVEDDQPGLGPELENALAGLTPRQRSLVMMRHVVGLDGDEIAAVIGTTRGAAYAALARAERRLRVQMIGGRGE